jgi:hypothetical protein
MRCQAQRVESEELLKLVASLTERTTLSGSFVCQLSWYVNVEMQWGLAGMEDSLCQTPEYHSVQMLAASMLHDFFSRTLVLYLRIIKLEDTDVAIPPECIPLDCKLCVVLLARLGLAYFAQR